MSNINIEIEMQDGRIMKAELYPEVAPITVAPLIFNLLLPSNTVPSAQIKVSPAESLDDEGKV